jgi:hypothetical protein
MEPVYSRNKFFVKYRLMAILKIKRCFKVEIILISCVIS